MIRVDAGLSLSELARRLGVSVPYLSRVERGHDAPPTPDRVVAIADALEVPPLVLLEIAQGAGVALAGYLERVPEAGTLFLEMARRNLGTAEIGRIKAFIDRELAGPVPLVRQMRLTELVGDRVLLRVVCDDLEDAIAIAATRLADDGGAARALAARIIERERAAPSLLGSGVVVPHAVMRGVGPAAAVITLDPPLAAATPDGDPLRVAVVIVSPSSGRRHLQLLAHVARLAARGLADLLAEPRTPARALARLAALDVS